MSINNIIAIIDIDTLIRMRDVIYINAIIFVASKIKGNDLYYK